VTRKHHLRGEDELVKRFKHSLGGVRSFSPSSLVVASGDDAAVVKAPRGQEIVVSVDASLEGVHFLGAIHPPESVGYKSLARAASDLAAMGARPLWFLLQIGLPKEKTEAWLDRFLLGMRAAANEFKLVLAGGDTSRFPAVTISITVFGAVKCGRAITRISSSKVTRARRRANELLYVSGRLGGAQLGLELVRSGILWDSADRNLRRLLRPHMFPRVPIALSQWLAAENIPSAMMDISDGLSTDLSRLCAANEMGAVLRQEYIPQVKIPADFGRLHLDSLELALHGGDDYGLLFAVPERRKHRLSRSPWAKSVTEIGYLVDEPGIFLLRGKYEPKLIEPRGWDPFAGRLERGDTNSR
jgi:thiamine-monophosphate kinase